MKNKFSVELVGYFYSLELYDCRGSEVFELEEAVAVAEKEYGNKWQSVFNGNEGISREDWMAKHESN
jgi:hypothetical protein